MKRAVRGITFAVFALLPMLLDLLNAPLLLSFTVYIMFFIIFAVLNISFGKTAMASKRLYYLTTGCELLWDFCISSVITLAVHILYVYFTVTATGLDWRAEWYLILGKWILFVLVSVISEAVVFWNGMIRVFLTSVQLGVRHRVEAFLLGWAPIANICYLVKIIGICSDEVKDELTRIELDNARAENEVCKTKYPLLLVHGVFFRDFRYLNYWGRIPAALIKNGAEIYYGSQQSAASVEECGKELAEKIREITEKTGCEKVNIIAHSKGGLDSRAAISLFGADKNVASLTTINTPHKGCVFADYLLRLAPKPFKNGVAAAYNKAVLKLGDKNPDFLGAVTDLTSSRLKELNLKLPDSPSVLYESVMSYCKKAEGGRFPLNISYKLVKLFDGKNDGLVSVESAKYGSAYTLVEPKGDRGISHGDMIDLNRENIKDFDVREFYVGIVSSLKNRGY